MKKHLSTILLVIIFLIGLSLLLYPTFSDWWNSFHQSTAIISYENAAASLAPADYSAFFADAQEYNEQLAQVPFPLMYYDQVDGYDSILDVTGTGIMGYLEIPKIKLSLPVYHGTSENVLQVAVGHLQGSSLPIGGEGTHSVLSAHRGLPSARLFTDLDMLEVGDTFTVTVLDLLMTYEIDQILIVEPQDVEALYVQDGMDLCTLVTCTPYGVNSHRLLVRGHRIENMVEAPTIRVTGDAVQIAPIIVAPFVALPMLLALLIILLFPKRKSRKDMK